MNAPRPRRGLRRAAGTAAAASFALCAAALCAACRDAPEPPRGEIYSLVLTEARSRLRLETPVQLHPLPAMLELDDGPGRISLLRFNDFDTLAIPGIVRAESEAYRLCTPGAAGGCRVDPGQTALILSDLLDLQDNGLAVLLILTDRRTDTDVIQYWGARVKPALRGWDVVEFTRFRR